MAQTYKNWEIIAIDDESTDDSLSILKSYQAKIPKQLRVISQLNHGVAYSRNLGLDISSGDYIMFVDDDDYVDNIYIEEYVNEIERTDNDCVIGGFRREDGKGKIVKKYVPCNLNSVYIADLMPWARIIKRDFLVKKSIRFLNNSIGEDVYFNFCILSMTNKVSLLNTDSYVWFYNELSVSNRQQVGLREVDDFITLLEKIIDIYNDSDFIIDWVERYIIWYMLYSGRKASVDDFVKADEKMFAWLTQKRNQHQIYGLKVIKEDRLIMKIAIKMYLIVKRMKLIRLFAIMYCR